MMMRVCGVYVYVCLCIYVYTVFTKGFSLIKNENKMKITLVKTRNDRSLVMVVSVVVAVVMMVRPQIPGWSAKPVCRALGIYYL